MKTVRFRHERQNEFFKAFQPLCERHSSWQVWSDFIVMSAIALAAPLTPREDTRRQKREEEYLHIMRSYSQREQQIFPNLFAIMVQALEDTPEQDFLGEMFMLLELSNHWHGQFFTPYDVCRFMAEMSLQGAEEQIRRKGWIGICENCTTSLIRVAAA